MPRGVASPVLRALDGNVLQQWSNAPSFDPICIGSMPGLLTSIPVHQAKVEEAWRKERVKGGAKAAAQMFRYADDWIILVRGTKSQARDIKERCKEFLREELGLELSEEKTAVTHITDGFDLSLLSHLPQHQTERRAGSGDLCTSR
jgi:hypothetical protein